MKRREVLKFLPLSAASLGLFREKSTAPAGATGLGKVPGFPEARSGHLAEHSLLAEVKLHNGTPTLFLNGRPSFPGIYWVPAPESGKWDFAEQARRNADTGIHIYAFDVGKGREWVGPTTSPSHPFDFSTVEERFGRQQQRAEHLTLVSTSRRGTMTGGRRAIPRNAS